MTAFDVVLRCQDRFVAIIDVGFIPIVLIFFSLLPVGTVSQYYHVCTSRFDNFLLENLTSWKIKTSLAQDSS